MLVCEYASSFGAQRVVPLVSQQNSRLAPVWTDMWVLSDEGRLKRLSQTGLARLHVSREHRKGGRGGMVTHQTWRRALASSRAWRASACCCAVGGMLVGYEG